jgi:hypothetical protein
MQINRAQHPPSRELESTMSTTLKHDGYHFLVSPDRAKSAWVHPLDKALPKYAGWTDCTDMSEDEFDRFIAEDQAAQLNIATAGA